MVAESMQAARLHAPGKLRLETVPSPVPGPGEVLVRVRACGLDRDLVARRKHQGAPCPLPRIPGRYFSGEVAASGADAEDIETGARVTAMPLLPCGACAHCSRGRHRFCERSGLLGCTRDGACARYVKVSRSQTLALPPGVSLEEGAMVGPAASALRAWKKLELAPGASAGVFGLDPVGALALQWARGLGAARTIAVDVCRQRLEAARALGADAAVEAGVEDIGASIRKWTRGRGLEGALVAAGPPEFFRESLLAAAPGGRVVWGGWDPGAGVSLTSRGVEALQEKEIILRGVCDYAAADPTDRDWEQALLFLQRGLLAAEELVTHRLPLEQAGQGLDLMREGGRYHNQVLVLPGF